MQAITEITGQGTRFGYVIHTREIESGFNFFGLESDNLQVAVMLRSASNPVLPHFHNEIVRHLVGTPEVLFICKGKALAHFYNQNSERVVTHTIQTGDALVLLHGGHGIEFLDECKIIEIKQGPYFENCDKTWILEGGV